MLVFMVGSSGVLVLLSGDDARFVPVPQRGKKTPREAGLSLKKGGTQPLNARKSFVSSRNSSPTTRLMRASIVSQTNLLWAPGIPVGLVVLAFAQIGVHLVFFLHLGSGPDSTNNILALAFGVLIVFLVIAGSVWIIANLNSNMMPMSMQRAGKSS
jgi:cytochrome o ubiquinol oxidase subunit IV